MFPTQQPHLLPHLAVLLEGKKAGAPLPISCMESPLVSLQGGFKITALHGDIQLLILTGGSGNTGSLLQYDTLLNPHPLDGTYAAHCSKLLTGPCGTLCLF